jgi:protein TonB
LAAVFEPSRTFHSRGVLAIVVVSHVFAGLVLFQLLERVRPPMPQPITVTLVAEPPPAIIEEPVDIPPQPLPQADPAPVPLPPKRVEAPPPPPKPAEPPPQAELPVPPEPEPAPLPPPPIRQAEPIPAPVTPAPPPPPVARAEPAPTLPAPVEPVRPPAPVTVAPPPPPPVAESAPLTEPLYGADYLRNPKPVYPLMSRRMGEQGVVLLRVFVTAAGDPRQIELKEGSGFVRLDRAAQEVVQRWKFVPAKRGDRPVDAWVVVPIRFSLKG